jgi:Uncharacterised nucleotidyltransferase
MKIIIALLTSSLNNRNLVLGSKAVGSVLEKASSAEWEAALEELERHKVLPLVGYTVAASGLREFVPEKVLKILASSYKKCLLTNRLIMNIVGRVIRELRHSDIEPTMFKGVVLADSVYPDPGTRVMADMDFLIRPDQRDPTAHALAKVGFKRLPGAAEEDAVCYGNHYGVLLDVHERFRLFPETDSLTVDLKPRHIDLDRMRVWEPNAMLVHLVNHLESHRSEYGYRLSWLVDLGFLVQRWGAELDWRKLRALLSENERDLVTIIRLLRFLERELQVQVPAAIASHGGTVRPLSLESVLRGARLAPWGLPWPRGWARLLACAMGVAPRRNRRYPNLSDPLLWPEDMLFERLTPGKLAHPHAAA